jgi:hypothetical protein
MNLHKFIELVDRKMVPIERAVLLHDEKATIDDSYDIEYTTRLQLWQRTRLSPESSGKCRFETDQIVDRVRGRAVMDIHRSLYSDVYPMLVALETAVRYGEESDVLSHLDQLRSLITGFGR